MIKRLSCLPALLAAALLIACGNGPIEPDEIEDLIEGEQDWVERQERESCVAKYSLYDCNWCYNQYGSYTYSYCFTSYSSSSRYSSSSYNYWDDEDYYSSSSSYYYSNVSIYTYKPSTITITLSYYHQLKSMDENNNTDGDPRIVFGVKSYSDGVRQDSVQTSTINLGDNVGTWSGSKSVTAKLSGGIDEILVCPVFTDADPFFDDHEYSSNYCYYVHDLGKKIGQTIQQDDYMATYFDLEWSVKVNYN